MRNLLGDGRVGLAHQYQDDDTSTIGYFTATAGLVVYLDLISVLITMSCSVLPAGCIECLVYCDC